MIETGRRWAGCALWINAFRAHGRCHGTIILDATVVACVFAGLGIMPACVCDSGGDQAGALSCPVSILLLLLFWW